MTLSLRVSLHTVLVPGREEGAVCKWHRDLSCFRVSVLFTLLLKRGKMLLKDPVKSIILHICTVRKCATTLRFEQDMFPGDHHQLLAVTVVDLNLI